MRLETETVMHRVTLYQINSVLLSCYTIASRRAEQYLSFDRWAALVLIITPLTYILHDVKEEEAVHMACRINLGLNQNLFLSR
jgi:uncharacterized protein (DUF4213/DUF364 family)